MSIINRKHYHHKLEHAFPSWYAILYGAGCGFLIPWTILLSIILPPHYIVRNWDIAWIGFDSFECLLFAVTAFLAFRHSAWTAISAAILGTTLLIDAWFDIMTSRSSRDINTALMEAFVLEIPLALLSYIITWRVFRFTKQTSLDCS